METMQTGAALVAADGSRRLSVFGIQVDVLLTAEDTDNLYSTYKVSMEPGAGIPPHLHRREEESFFVLQGDFEVLCGDTVSHVTAGSQIFMPRNTPHALRNVGAGQGQLLGMCSPAGHERFFEDVDQLGAEGPPDMDEAMAVCLKHEIELVLPPEAPGQSH